MDAIHQQAADSILLSLVSEGRDRRNEQQHKTHFLYIHNDNNNNSNKYVILMRCDNVYYCSLCVSVRVCLRTHDGHIILWAEHK